MSRESGDTRGRFARLIPMICILAVMAASVSLPPSDHALALSAAPSIGVPGGPCRSPWYPTSMWIERNDFGASPGTRNAEPFFRAIPHRPVVDRLYAIACDSYPIIHPTACSGPPDLGVAYSLGFRHDSHILLRFSITTNGCFGLVRHDGRAFDEGLHFQDVFCDMATALYVHEADLFPVAPGAPTPRHPEYAQCDRHHLILPGSLLAPGSGPS